MAMIEGVTLKAVKTWQGREGVCNQGNIYIDHKKAGWYSENDSVLEPEIVFENQDMAFVFEERKKKFFDKYPQSYHEDVIFFDQLLHLIVYEKQFKKAVKQGYKALICQNPLTDSDEKESQYEWFGYVYTNEFESISVLRGLYMLGRKRVKRSSDTQKVYHCLLYKSGKKGGAY